MYNIASIYSMAAQELQAIDKIDDAPIGNEWSTMFFDYAKDVDDEKIQIIWSKILAGEIAKSGSFYKRTLSVLKNIEPFEAEWFVEACSLVFCGYLIDEKLSSDFITYNKILSLMDCGLLNPTKCELHLNKKDVRNIPFKTCVFKKEDNEPFGKHSINGLYSLTDAGCQLYADCVDVVGIYLLHDIPVNTDNTPSCQFAYGFHNFFVAHHRKTDGRSWNLKRHENQCVPLENAEELVFVTYYCVSCKRDGHTFFFHKFYIFVSFPAPGSTAAHVQFAQLWQVQKELLRSAGIKEAATP